MLGDSFFRSMERLESRMKSSTYKQGSPASLTDSDFDGFEVAVKARRGPLTTEQIIATLKRKNAVRWRRLHKDYRWMQREFKKMGLNPDDAKELL